jgi:hypothetical protein
MTMRLVARAVGRALTVVLVLWLMRCTVAVPSSPTLRPAVSAAPVVLGHVRLLPSADGAFKRWELRNETAEAIHPVSWTGFTVWLEQSGPDGWEPVPIARCGTVAPEVEPLAGGASRVVTPLPPIGSEALPAGQYRARVEYVGAADVERLRAGAPSITTRAVTTAFEVVGLTKPESDAFGDMIATPEARTCLDRSSLANYVERFSWTADRAAVPRLLDVRVATYDEHLVLARAMTILPDAADVLLAAEARATGDAAVAAGVALFTDVRARAPAHRVA